jgi:phosphoenolpyruvate carboxylase
VTAGHRRDLVALPTDRRTNEIYGDELLGPIVISMTHTAADVLTVLLLAKWAGCDPPQIAPLLNRFKTSKTPRHSRRISSHPTSYRAEHCDRTT